MKAFTQHWSRLRKRVVRGLMRALFTEEAMGRGETVNSMGTTDCQSQPAGDSSSEAADAGHGPAGRTRTHASPSEQG